MFTYPHDEMSLLKDHTLTVNWLNETSFGKSVITVLSWS